MPIFPVNFLPAGWTFPIGPDGRGETRSTEHVAAGRGSQEGSVLFNLGQADQADGALGPLRIAGARAGGGWRWRWRLSEVHNVLVGGLRGSPHTEIQGTLSRAI